MHVATDDTDRGMAFLDSYLHLRYLLNAWA